MSRARGEVQDVHEVFMLTFQHIALHRARLPGRMIEVKRALCLYIVVSTISQAVVLADQDLCAAAGELCGCELFLVVFLVRRGKLALHRVVAED